MKNNSSGNLAWYCASHNTRRWQALLRVSHTQVILINEWHIKNVHMDQTNIHKHSYTLKCRYTHSYTNK